MILVIHGENELARQAALQAALDVLIAPEERTFGIETLQPPVEEKTLRAACLTPPMWARQRVLVVLEMCAREAPAWVKGGAAWLEQIPESTALIFVESQTLPDKHPLLQLASKQGGHSVACPLPEAKSLPQWVQARMTMLGGKIEMSAAALLAQNIGQDVLLLDQELRKLQLYKKGKGTVTVEDIERLVPYIYSADVIFQVVDALGQRDAATALRLLERMLIVGEQHPLAILRMVVRQFRLLLLVRWYRDRAHSEESIAERLKVNPYVVKKVYRQAGFFTQAQLQRAYAILLETEYAIKRGTLEAETALQVLMTELTRL